jgi:hypothetical protein
MYERRTVAFLDLLGFKSAIEKTPRNLLLVLKVRDALKSMAEFATPAGQREPKGSQLAVAYVQSFSDSIVICGGPAWVLQQVTRLTWSLLPLGFAIRGGVVTGDIYYSDGVVFGPALIQAWRTEKEDAKVPRVLIPKSSAKEIVASDINLLSVWCATDKDDAASFVDFLRPRENNIGLQGGPSYQTVMASARCMICESLRAQADNSVRQKYLWLRDYFNSTIRLYKLSEEQITES